MTAPLLIAIYACVAIALHELVFRHHDGLTPFGVKVFSWAWPVWALGIVVLWSVLLVLEFANRWRKP